MGPLSIYETAKGSEVAETRETRDGTATTYFRQTGLIVWPVLILQP